MRTLILGTAALMMLSVGVSSAQLDSSQQDCANTLHKDAMKISIAQAKQLAGCVKDAQKGTITDLAACLAAAPNDLVTKALGISTADSGKFCGSTPATFGIAPAFEITTNEAAVIHTRGLITDLLGASPTVPGDKAGNACQSMAVKKAQGFAKSYAKAAAKCVRDQLKTGATGGSALSPCLAPDLAKYVSVLATAVAKSCEGANTTVALPGVCSGLSGSALANCVTYRATCRTCRMLATDGGLDTDCDLIDDGQANASCSFPVSISGEAFKFNGAQEFVPDAYIWVLEHPEMNLVTGADGHFEFSGLEEGSEVTLVLEHPDYHPIQTGTIHLGATGAQRVTFQAVPWDVYNALASVLALVPDELNKCQMVTTVTCVGKSMYDEGAHGEVAATVDLTPALPAENGPIYFNSSVIPQTNLTKTSDDGGVLYVQVPPGEYVWTAHKGSAIFTRVKMKCRVGLLVDASPPWGLQKH